jgi:hypothetical protein
VTSLRAQRSKWSANAVPSGGRPTTPTNFRLVLESLLLLLAKDSRPRQHSKPITRTIQHAAPAASF